MISIVEGWKILQIIPAIDWYAMYEIEDDANSHAPLVCWALVEDRDGDRHVVGLDSAETNTDFCENTSNFMGYIHREQSA
jgi:hypothetical protein